MLPVINVKYILINLAFITSIILCDMISDTDSEEEFLRDRRAILKKQDFFWKFPINYFISPGVNRASVAKAINFIQSETCITFKEVFNLQTAIGLNFVSDQGCFAFTGRVENTTTQEVGVAKECSTPGWVQHMIGHSLGLYHQEVRHDRGKYVRIFRKNIRPKKLRDFRLNRKKEVITYNFKYDFGGLMQSNKTAKTKNGKWTIQPYNRNYWQTIGQTTRLSFNELKTLNYYYCSRRCPKKLKCDNRGYTNPKLCNVCKCPRNYAGNRCQRIAPSSPGCPRVYIRSTERPKIILIRGIKNCYHQIKTTRGFKIRMVLLEASLPKTRLCTPDQGLEIKFFRDKTVTGNLFCGIRKNVVIRSKGYHVTFHYRGTQPFHFIRLLHQRVRGP